MGVLLKLVFLILAFLFTFSLEFLLLNYTIESPIKLNLTSNFISMPSVNILIWSITLYNFFFLKNYKYNLLLLTAYILIINLNFKFNLMYTNSVDEYFFNSLLSNSLNYIHPALVIYVWSFIIIFSFLTAVISTKVLKKKLLIYKLVKTLATNIKNCFFILNFTILLGFWWAQQLNTWQGWWAWDKSEVLILIIFWSFISILHLYLKKKDTIVFLFNFIYLSVIIYFYYVYEISFFTNLHTFFSSITFNLNFFQLYNSTIVLTLLVLLLVKKSQIKFKYNLEYHVPLTIIVLFLLNIELKTFITDSWIITVLLLTIILTLNFNILKVYQYMVSFFTIKTMHNYFWYILPIFLFNYFNFLYKTSSFLNINLILKISGLKIQNHLLINNKITNLYEINTNFKFYNNIQVSEIKLNSSNSLFFNNWNLNLNAKNLVEIHPSSDIILALLI